MKNRVISLVLALVMCVGLAVPAFADEITPMTVLKTEEEPNDSMATANSASQDNTFTGYIHSPSDVDYFKIIPNANGVFKFRLWNIPTGKDYELYVYNSSGALLACSIVTGTTHTVVFTETAVEIPSSYSPLASRQLLLADCTVASEVLEPMADQIAVATSVPYGDAFVVCDPYGTTSYSAPEPFGTSYAAETYNGLEYANGIYFLT